MASRTNWGVEIYSGGVYSSDGTIYAPNENLDLDTRSNQSATVLADGSRAFITPETLYLKDPIRWVWLYIAYTDAFITKIRNYVQNQSYIRITDSNSDTYIGRFISLRRIWLTGVDNYWDLQAEFMQHE